MAAKVRDGEAGGGAGGSTCRMPACWTSAAALDVSCTMESAVRACARTISVKADSIG